MPRRFVYAPDVEAFIQTSSGIIDVSDDIINGDMTLRLNAVSSFSLTLQNPHRKYLGVIHSMDPIVIYLTRVKRMLAFSGYVDVAPIDQLYPEPVTITGSCTMKRLLHTYWNPALPYLEQFLYSMGWQLDPLSGNLIDATGKSLWNMDASGSLGNMLQQILHKIGGWDLGTDKHGNRVNTQRNAVQILALPKPFIKVSAKLLASQRRAQQEYENKVTNFLNQLLTVKGITTDPFGSSSASLNDAQDNVSDSNPLPKAMAGRYKASIYGPQDAISGFAAALQKETKGHFDLTAEQCRNAAVIASVFKKFGFNDRATAAFVAVAWSPESDLIADRIQGSHSAPWNKATSDTPGDPSLIGYGLFQLTDTNGQWFGSDGYLAKGIEKLTGHTPNPIPRRPSGVNPGDVVNTVAFNPAYNAAARAISVTSNDRDALNNSSDPAKLVSALQNTGSVSGATGGDYNSIKSVYPFVWKAMQAAANTSNTNQDSGTDGSIGQVRVGDPGFFDQSQAQASHGHDATGDTASNGYTFRIKPNPYGNDTFIFAATAYDPKLSKDEISIWIPLDSTQAQNWNTKEISVETSFGHKPFPPSTSGVGTGESSAVGDKVVKLAEQELGVPYVYGGESEKGFDCSGLTAFVYNKVGVALPHNAQLQFNQGPKLGPTDPLEPGDLIFFGADTNSIGHVGMVVNPSQRIMIDAPHTGADVRTERYPVMGGAWGSDRLVGGTRPGGNAPGGAGSNGGNSAAGPDTSGSGVQMDTKTFADTVGAVGLGLPMVFPMATDALEAQLFTGERAYQDAQPLMNLVDFVCKASARNFKSTPKGDFLAFYPDYFNWAGQSPYFVITDIELQDLTINFTDEPLATHVFTTADTLGMGSIQPFEEISSTIASVESLGSFPELVNVGKHFNSKAFLEKFGARPLNEEVPEIKNGFMQFMYGWMTFLEQWAKLFEANPTFTFMPELIPGGLVRFATKDLTMYINEITHTFDRESGFTTKANLIAPSTSSKGSYSLMVLNGGVIKSNV